MKKLLLEIELIPASSWYSNVRSNVTKKQWDIIRNKVYSEAYNLCQICGEQGNKHPVECHEMWEFDDFKLIQKLIGMIALCPMCHATKHYGLSKIQGKEEIIFNHFIKINNIDKVAVKHYIDSVFKIWETRSQKEWELDISILKNYGVDIYESNNSKKDRVVKKSTTKNR